MKKVAPQAPATLAKLPSCAKSSQILGRNYLNWSNIRRADRSGLLVCKHGQQMKCGVVPFDCSATRETPLGIFVLPD